MRIPYVISCYDIPVRRVFSSILVALIEYQAIEYEPVTITKRNDEN